MKTISVQDLHNKMQEQPVKLFDVRGPAEFAQAHAKGAVQASVEDVDVQEALDAEHDIYIICKAGMRAAGACQAIMQRGYDNVVLVNGGTDAWLAAGLPAESGN